MIDYTYLPAAKWLAGGGLLMAAVVLASYLWAKGRPSRGLRVALGSLRWLILAGILFCLFDPGWVEAIKHQQKSRLAVLLDTSRSMSIKDLPEERLSAAKQWLRNHLAPAAPPQFSFDYYTFNETLSPLPNLESVRATGDATGLADALERVLSAPGDDPLIGVLICSDGIENLGRDPEAVAKTYRRKGIPIHTVLTGTTNDMRDVILENVQVRRVVPNQAPTKVAVTLRAPGYAQHRAPLQILHDGQVVALAEVHLTGGSQRVEVDFTPRQKGFQVYEARVPALAGEWLTSNNRRLFGMEIIDPTLRVLYMEGTPQQPNCPIPEWRYLKAALESDPDIKVTTLYREFSGGTKRLHAADTDPVTGERIYPVEHPRHGFPRTLAELLEYDVIIHSDIKKESFTSEQLRNMARLVEEFGGGFIMIGGNSAFGKGGYHRTALDRIIPVAMRQENDSEARPFKMQVPAAAWSHPIIALGGNRKQTELIWKKLPALHGYNQVDRAKPGAIVLGEDPTSRSGRNARLVLAAQNIGRGRSMAFTSDTTRTWGKDFETLWGEKINPSLPLTEENCDSRYYRQFWVNATRWLAAGRLGNTNTTVALELAQSHCQPHEKVTASVQVRDQDFREISTAVVSILAVNEGKTNWLGAATFNNASRAYTADVALPASGNFILTAVATARSRPLGEDRQLLVCEEADREMADVRARPELLAKLSQISGGQTLSLTESDAALGSALFCAAPPVTVEHRRDPLWDQPWWLAAVLGLLGVEWAVRRLNGMA